MSSVSGVASWGVRFLGNHPITLEKNRFMLRPLMKVARCVVADGYGDKATGEKIGEHDTFIKAIEKSSSISKVVNNIVNGEIPALKTWIDAYAFVESSAKILAKWQIRQLGKSEVCFQVTTLICDVKAAFQDIEKTAIKLKDFWNRGIVNRLNYFRPTDTDTAEDCKMLRNHKWLYIADVAGTALQIPLQISLVTMYAFNALRDIKLAPVSLVKDAFGLTQPFILTGALAARVSSSLFTFAIFELMVVSETLTQDSIKSMGRNTHQKSI